MKAERIFAALLAALKDGLAELIIGENPQPGDTLHVSFDQADGKLRMKIEKA